MLEITAAQRRSLRSRAHSLNPVVSISQNGLTTTIDQHSQNLSLNWQSFNVGADSTVNFVQPNAKSIAVNRIADPNAQISMKAQRMPMRMIAVPIRAVGADRRIQRAVRCARRPSGAG